MSREADFSYKVKRVVAERAGHRCSFLGCDKTTLGPAKSDDKSLKDSIAAHIYASEMGEARGTGGLIEEQHKSAANGIWICSSHANLIDKNNGRDYPASLLQSSSRGLVRFAAD